MKLPKPKYRHLIFLWFFIAFAIFTTGIILFQQIWEKNVKTEALEKDLDSYALMVNRFIETNHKIEDILEISSFFPNDIRISVIDLSGNVLFDNRFANLTALDNHLNRIEIQGATTKGTGHNIRLSESTGSNYFYFAHKFDQYYVRVAILYDIEVQSFLRADNFSLYFVLLLFATTLILLVYISSRLGKAITALRDFTLSTGSSQTDHLPNISFPDTEFGDIANQIAENYQQLKITRDQLALQQEKLVQCFQNSEEGVGLFSPTFESVFFNTRFVTYVNTILDENTVISEQIFNSEEFLSIKEFLNHEKAEENHPPYMIKIVKNGKHFSVSTILFHDRSFQVIIHDITQTETTRLLKQEMTNNIAHELRTPVSSIRGYLETLLQQEDIDAQTQHTFIKRSYRQTLKLSELIRDISLITKIEEAPGLFTEEKIDLMKLLRELQQEFAASLAANHIHFEMDVPEGLSVKGNRTLIYSIFRNLIENSIAYAGQNITIKVHCYNENQTHYFFSFSDTGKGVPEGHLPKIFNRFYRIDEGRTRDSGGSGLGLSIVKNAILFHHGEVVAKNRKNGGLEFLFTLQKGK